MQLIPLLTAAECDHTRLLVHALRPWWVQRSPLPFFTLGATTYMDAAGSRRRRYLDLAVRVNPLLHQHFGWLHDRVVNALTTLLGQSVVMAPGLALPGFHVFLSHPAFMQPLASVHVDLQYREHPWDNMGVPDFERPISFTLAVALPAAGGGLLTWPRGLSHARSTSDIDMAALLQRTLPTYVPYTAGSLVVHDGHLAHQIAPPARIGNGDERITLQGHALRCGDTYYAYW